MKPLKTREEKPTVNFRPRSSNTAPETDSFQLDMSPMNPFRSIVTKCCSGLDKYRFGS
jgi:hypothetical protein